MAALPSPTQVAGTHSAIYEAYYNQVDPNGSGMIQALDAARFLKKSRLSDVVLSKIWDLSDPNGKGYLDKAGLFVALKLVALAQAGKDISMSNIQSEAPPPKLGELPKVPPTSVPPARPAAPSPSPPALSDWTMKPHERDKYSQLFDSLQPNNGLIAGNKVKGVLMESKLPLETLGKIWDLADQDRDGMLDRHEFMVAMHLVYKALEKHAVPTTLPPELRPRAPPSRPASPRPPPPRPHPPAHPPAPAPVHQSNASLLEGLLDLSSPTQTAPTLPSSISSMPSIPPVPSLPAQSSWVVTPAEKAQYDAQFALADLDRDGYVSGAEIKHAFLESGLPQSTLAQIWALCDTRARGKLSRAQYALAMWLVARALRGTPPPAALHPDMLPPDDDPQCWQQPAVGGGVGGGVEAVQLGAQPTPEMEAIAREVEALARERLALDADRAGKQHALTTAAAEAHALQSELDTLTATLKQLENQKGEAQKRLNDLKTQVEKLRSQVSAQEAAAAETEAEVAARRAAAQTLKEKERALQQEVTEAQAEAEGLTAQLRKTVLAVSQANIKISHLEEHHRVLEEACAALAGGGGGGGGGVDAAQLALQPLHARDHLQRVVRGATPNDALEDSPFPPSNGFGSPAASGFASDPFSSATHNDPFAPNNNAVKDGFSSDPFAPDADLFAGDAFATQNNAANTNDDGAWSDPFAVLHAPTRDVTPTPALPPKRHKTPPPRPAPPRHNNTQHKTDRANMDFTDDPFKDYRYEDPFNIEDPFADAAPPRAGRPTSVAGFETDDFFASSTLNGSFTLPTKHSGRVSAPPVAYDPFSGRSELNTTNNNETWAAWPNDNWATDSAWTEPTSQKADAWSAASKNTNVTNNDRKTENWANKSDNWANKTDNWATDWSIDQNKNLNETWPNTLPAKKEKSPRPVKYAKSLVNTIGGIGRSRQKEKKAKEVKEAKEAKELRASAEALPSEETQWAWAAAESRRLQLAAEHQRRQEDAELQLALALSRQDK